MLGSEQRKSIGTWHQSSNTDTGLTAPVCELNYAVVFLIPSLISLTLICFWQYLHKYRVILFKEKLDEFEWERNDSKRLWPCPLTSHSSPRPQELDRRMGYGEWALARWGPVDRWCTEEISGKTRQAWVLAWHCHLPKVIFSNLLLICKMKDNVSSFKKELQKCKTHTHSVENTHFWLSNRERAGWAVCPWAYLRFQGELFLLESQKSVVGEPRQSSLSSKATGNTNPNWDGSIV